MLFLAVLFVSGADAKDPLDNVPFRVNGGIDFSDSVIGENLKASLGADLGIEISRVSYGATIGVAYVGLEGFFLNLDVDVGVRVHDLLTISAVMDGAGPASFGGCSKPWGENPCKVHVSYGARVTFDMFETLSLHIDGGYAASDDGAYGGVGATWHFAEYRKLPVY